MPESEPGLSIIIPAFNEAERLPGTLRILSTWLGKQVPGHEILVVDDGSTDSTPEIVRVAAALHPSLRLLHHPVNAGKGAAVRRGMLAARGRIRIFMDADLSTPVGEIPGVMRLMEDGADVVIGSRAIPGANVRVAQKYPRRSLGKLFNLCVRLLTRLPWRDTQCGFKAFTAEAAEAVFFELHETAFAADVEMLLIARAKGFDVREMPVEWINSPDSRVSLFCHPPAMLTGLLRTVWRHRTRRAVE